ncbi:EVE domain-containing protein [Silvibacterium sp.]|uniref:EVE domain-containing protein n=1 Tax=Silvibacterium sp. TaxID=1964179 RepID=UPI0039E39974
MDTIAGYLLKTEPSVYSFADLQRDVETTWDGVTNPAAVKFLREMKKGAKCVIYHTGDERTAIGTATVLSVDPTDSRAPIVRIKVGKPVKTPHSLAEIKANPIFTQSPLVTQSRLSVVPLNEAQWDWLTLS